MATLTINLDDDTAARLKQAAKERGTTVDELLAASVHLVLNAGGAYELSEEEERMIEESDAEAERGEVISHEEMMEKIQALRR